MGHMFLLKFTSSVVFEQNRPPVRWEIHPSGRSAPAPKCNHEIHPSFVLYLLSAVGTLEDGRNITYKHFSS